MTKQEIIDRVSQIADNTTEWFKKDGKVDYYYDVVVKDWKNYGKDRTYINVYERRTGSRHSKLWECGYYDNIADKYVPTTFDITKDGDKFL